MYLIEIDPETGLISEDVTNSGWMAIKDFSKLVKKFGIKAMTVVALTADYQSPLRHYKDKDRPDRAVDEIYSNRKGLDLENELIVNALGKYRELQLDPDLETDRLNKEIKLRLIDKVTVANNADDDAAIEKYRNAMQKHEVSVTSFNQRFDKRVAMDKAVTSTGYQLSRIEADIKSRKKSKFVNHGDGLENPDRLGLNQKNIY